MTIEEYMREQQWLKLEDETPEEQGERIDRAIRIVHENDLEEDNLEQL